MNGTGIIFIILGAIAVAALIIIIIRRISAYYRDMFGFSIWSGVTLIVLSAALAGYSLYNTQPANIPLIIIAALVFSFAIFLDVRHTGFAMGLLALLAQLIIAVLFIAIIVIAIILLIVRAITKNSNDILGNLGKREVLGDNMGVFLHSFLP